MDFSNYKFRPSGLGKLMTNDRSGKAMGETAKKYLLEVYIKELYGREKDISNKYTEKGLLTEEDSLTRMQAYYGKLPLKNKVTLENDFIRGTPDLIWPDRVTDAKSSWNIFTFLEADGSNKDYYWQGQGYMWLADKEKFDLIYCLNNTPEYLIVSEKTRKLYQLGLEEGTPAFDEMENEVDKNMIFDDIPEDKRIRVFEFTRDMEAILAIQSRVIEAREYLNSLTFNYGEEKIKFDRRRSENQKGGHRAYKDSYGKAEFIC